MITVSPPETAYITINNALLTHRLLRILLDLIPMNERLNGTFATSTEGCYLVLQDSWTGLSTSTLQ